MAAVTASMVKELREQTGAGMMDCKKALAETDGDMEKALEYLREKGQATAEKKAGRIAAEGLVMFVAKNADFQAYVEQVAKQALNTSATDIEGFLAEPWAEDSSKTVEEALVAEIAVIGENLKIRRFERVTEDNGFIASYIHMGGKIGVLIDVETDVINDEIREMAKNVAMQAAALKPVYTTRDEVSQDFIEKEKEILTVAAKNEKPDADDKIINGMVQGRINKELKDICLVDQIYIKAEDGKQSVQKYIDEVAKANSANVKIKKFVRFETGEGLEKKNEDFAAEVAAQMGN